jgi:putative transposase
VKCVRLVTQPYIHVRGATTSICRRTCFRKAFLAPWHPLVNEIWLYALADAARVTGVSIHMSKLVVTHHHTDVTPAHPNLPEFTRRLHSDVSRALNELLIEQGYDPPRQIWDGRPPHYLRLLDASAQMSQLTYDYLNQLAAGLVERPRHMPGRQLEYGMWATEGLTVKRPPVFFERTRPSELLCNPEAPPEVMRVFQGDLEGAIHHMRKLAREGEREIRAARKWPALGAQKLKRIHPSDEPRTAAEPGGQRVPTFRIGAGGSVGRLQRIAASTETRSFRREHAETRQRRLEGEDEPFPFGTYGQRVFHGAPVRAPYDDALLAQPGPLLHEVLEELEADPGEPIDRASVLDEVRDDIANGAAAVVDESELDYRRPDLEEPLKAGERPPPETKHRSDTRRVWPKNPRRLIVRRDARRGRPPKTPGSDPPWE